MKHVVGDINMYTFIIERFFKNMEINKRKEKNYNIYLV